MLFRVKICGVTNVPDALDAVDAGADAIGLNFFAGSRRCIDIATAQRITDALSGRAACVGVFVNAAADEIHRSCEAANLHFIQLHGDEPPDFLRELGNMRSVIRARRLEHAGMHAIGEDLAACRRVAGAPLAGLLLDAAVPGQFGGSGQAADWQQLANHQAWLDNLPLVLAGGLTPDNVAEAVGVVRPHAVDVATGVESSPGKKDRAKMCDFVAAARAALCEQLL